MAKKTNKLIDKVVTSLDWDSIYEVNRCFKLGVGEGTSVIPGLKRKVFTEGLTKNDIKNELKVLLLYVIDNDVTELFYGPWMIFWTNENWVEISTVMDEDVDPDLPDDDIGAKINIDIQSSLEVIYSPQRIHVIGSPIKNESLKDDSDLTRLESMLKKALDSENYEIASKIKELLALQNGGQQEDK